MSDWLDRLREMLGALSARERLLLIVVSALLGMLVVWLGVIGPVLSLSRGASERLSAAEQELAAVERLRVEYDEIRGRLGAVEARIQRGPRGNLFTTLESLARESAVKVDSMEPQPSPAGDRYRETKVQLVLKGVTLAQLVNYLHHVESHEQLLSVKSLRIRSRGDQPDLLDATFTVSSFEPV